MQDERCYNRVCLSMVLKPSEKLVEYLCLQCKYEEEISHAVYIYKTGQLEQLNVMIRMKGTKNHGYQPK